MAEKSEQKLTGGDGYQVVVKVERDGNENSES